jgi:hypothetical protein
MSVIKAEKRTVEPKYAIKHMVFRIPFEIVKFYIRPQSFSLSHIAELKTTNRFLLFSWWKYVYFPAFYPVSSTSVSMQETERPYTIWLLSHHTRKAEINRLCVSQCLVHEYVGKTVRFPSSTHFATLQFWTLSSVSISWFAATLMELNWKVCTWNCW